METSIRGGRTATRWSSRPAKKLADQFDQYVVGGKHVRGRATLGENIADLGGIVLGYEAFKKTEQFKRGEQLNGLTPDQRFFLGYALAWLGARRPEVASGRRSRDDLVIPASVASAAWTAGDAPFY